MNPNIAANQQRLFLEFVAQLRPHVRRDSSLPGRIKEIFARNRAIGSRDRKLYRELVYTWLRYLPWVDPLLDSDASFAAKIIAWLAPELKPTSAYRAAHCGDWPACPATLAEKAALLTQLVPGRANPPDEPPSATPSARRDDSPYPSAFSFQPSALLPAWFREHCPAAFESPHLDALTSRANVWVRIQANDRNLVIDEFKAQGWTIESPAGFPDALRLPPNAEVATSDAYRRGFVEIQDLGSQLVLAHAPVAPGGRWLDACAGAGGKTLQLARLLGEKGHVDATDIRLDILDELRDRAKRARLDNIAIIPSPVIARSSAQRDDVATQLNHLYDGVLIDAPCSGSGTWRRQPHLKWYVKPETIAAFAKTQLEILTVNAPHVKPGGLLVYATCSLSHHENQDVAAAFLKTHANFKAEQPRQYHGAKFDGLGSTLLPGTLNTDGFYVAVLRHISPAIADPASHRFYHGTRADLKPGDLIGAGYSSNYGTRRKANNVYLSANLEPAIWGAELAIGEGRGRIYVVEPTGPILDDPNLTDRKFPGNPTKSYRSKEPLRVTGEVTDWKGHSPEMLKTMKDHLERLKQQGIEAVDD